MTGVTKKVADIKRDKEFDFRDKKLPVIELFGPTIQGEGALAGRRSHFIRFGGCTYRCSWCDSMHAVEPEQVKKNARRMTADEIAAEILALPPATWVTLTGGDPCIHDLQPLVNALPERKFSIAVETQGEYFPEWLRTCNLVTISPKPPSSGIKPDLDKIERETQVLLNNGVWVVAKVVVFDDDDFEFAKEVKRVLHELEFYLSVGTPQSIEYPDISEDGNVMVNRNTICNKYRILSEKVLREPLFSDVAVLPQLHYLMWGSEKGR